MKRMTAKTPQFAIGPFVPGARVFNVDYTNKLRWSNVFTGGSLSVRATSKDGAVQIFEDWAKSSGIHEHKVLRTY